MPVTESDQMTPLVEMRGVSKAFPGVRALDDVSLAVYAGEVHMLLGQNGAGKSTLIKVLYGAHHPDRGEFLFEGRPVRIHSAADARRLGVAVIFQEFSLVPYLDIAQNIFLGREPRGRIPGTVDHRRMHAEARRWLELLGLELDTRTGAHRLGVAQLQLVEIAKALSQNARILVMDEPTAALSEHEIARLFDLIRTLKRDGIAIIYISHRLREVFEIGDRITVLRDGRQVASTRPAETTLDELVRLMVGREVDTTYRHRFCEQPGEVVLGVENLQADNGVRGATLEVRAGEIVGLAGLVGSGRTELARAIFGADRVREGHVRLDGRPIGGGPVDAVRAGVGLVPENRKTEGLALIRSVEQNLLAAGLERLFPGRWYQFGKAGRVVADLIDRLHIVTPSPRRLVKVLSGGNQQKVVVGKWLNADSRFFIFDEPTRGIDVGA
ncbi:MAG: sugar ABC transporter ATP-binding protein, partial [Gemmatimonadetes bacterium]|nr:sugar ABC transporter ATP-binding protein [Gemmatimonadota bacterium]